MVVTMPGTEWHLRDTDASELGSFASREEAEEYAAANYPYAAGTAFKGEPCHDRRRCGCRVCRGHREAHVFFTVPCRFTP